MTLKILEILEGRCEKAKMSVKKRLEVGQVCCSNAFLEGFKNQGTNGPENQSYQREWTDRHAKRYASY